MDRKLALFFVFLISLLIIPSAFADKIISAETTTNGLLIEEPDFEYMKENTTHVFNFHVYNLTSGFILDNTTVSCVFDLYNNSGSEVFSIRTGFSNIDFTVHINGGNFSESGHYAYLTTCNTSTVGGFISASFEVNSAGREINPSTLTFIGFLILVLFGMAAFFGFMSNTFKTDSKEQAVFYTPLKMFFLMLSMVFIALPLHISYIISRQYIKFNDLTNFITQYIVIYGWLLYIMIALVLLYFLYLVFSWFKFKKLSAPSKFRFPYTPYRRKR